MNDIQTLLQRNTDWANEVTNNEPDFFTDLAKAQHPDYLWIGCSDSRVPPSRIADLPPGALFVHRNIANLMIHTDLNSLSVLQYAVEVLEVGHIIVCGHYGCGGIAAAAGGDTRGVIDHWLQHIRDVYRHHKDEIAALPNQTARLNRLGELNVERQISNIARTGIVREAWKAGKPLAIHGLMYDLETGRLTDLDLRITGPDQVPEPGRPA